MHLFFKFTDAQNSFMHPSKRAPRPQNGLDLRLAMTRLHESLVVDDAAVPHDASPVAAAAAHLGTCKPEPAVAKRAELVAAPANRCRACGTSIAIQIIAQYAEAPECVQSAHELLVRAGGFLRSAEECVRGALESVGAEIDARRRERDECAPHLLRELLRVETELLEYALVTNDAAEARVRREFPLPELHEPVSGASRPSLGLIRELTCLLNDAGHTAEQISHLLPDGSGSVAAIDRVRYRLKPRSARERRKRSAPSDATAGGNSAE